MTVTQEALDNIVTDASKAHNPKLNLPMDNRGTARVVPNQDEDKSTGVLCAYNFPSNGQMCICAMM